MPNASFIRRLNACLWRAFVTLPQRFLRWVASLLVLVVLALPSTATAELEPYIALELGAAHWDYPYLDDSVNLAIVAAAGVDFTDWLGLELAYHHFGTMNFVADITEGELEVASFAAAAVITLPLQIREARPVLLAGTERLEYDEQSDGQSVFDTDSEYKGYAGLGLSLSRDDNSAIRLNLTAHDGGDIIRLTLGGKLGL